MASSIQPRVAVTQSGRGGTVEYIEREGTLSFHWEFGGGDCIAIVFVGTAAAWRSQHTWAAPRRDAILRFVGDELVREKAPNGVARVDEAQGVLSLEHGREPSGIQRAPIVTQSELPAAVARWRRVRERASLALLGLGALMGVTAWIGKKLFAVDEGTGAPLGLSVRTDRHIATLIQTLEGYVPSLHRDASKDRYRIGVQLVPLDGSEPRRVNIAGGLTAGSFSLAKVLGSDGAVLWYDVCGVGGIDLATYERIGSERLLAPPNPSTLRGAQTTPLPLSTEALFCAGLLVEENTWLGVHSDEELAQDYAPGRRLRPGARAESKRAPRKLYRGDLEPQTAGGASERYRTILSVSALSPEVHYAAAFLRLNDRSEPLLLDPPSALMVSSSSADSTATLLFSRIDPNGDVLWQVDSGLDRHSLQHILPGAESTAFVGIRPRVPNQVPEPLIVIVDHLAGGRIERSVW